MAEIRTINIGKEFIVKFGECETNVPDETVAAVCRDLPIYIEQAIRDKIVENGEISVEPVRRGHWDTGYFHDRVCSCCLHPDNDLNDYAHDYCPNCGAKMDGDKNGI